MAYGQENLLLPVNGGKYKNIEKKVIVVMSELKKNVILKKLRMPYEPIIPLVPPPFAMNMRGYASM